MDVLLAKVSVSGISCPCQVASDYCELPFLHVGPLSLAEASREVRASNCAEPHELIHAMMQL